MHRFVCVLLGLASLGGSPLLAAVTPGDSTVHLTVDGLERQFLLHVPPGYTGSNPVPLVLDFHGWSSNAAQQKGISGMVAVSDAEGFVLAHPDGLDNSWNAGICCSPNHDLDDVGFIRTVVSTIESEASIDPRRVYATGLSNGGGITQKLACEAADLFAAAAPLAFPIPYRPVSECHPSRPMPVLTFMGLTDVLVPYAGGAFGSAPETFAYWHDIDGCAGTTPDVLEPTGKSRCERYTHCNDGVEAGLCSITAHEFPGAFFSGHILYLNDDLNLAQVVWRFLSRFTLPETTAPRVGSLRGLATLKPRAPRVPRLIDGVSWRFGIGDGTWWASDGSTNGLSGTARRHGDSYTLTLTSAAHTALAAALSAKASTAGVTLDLAAGTGRETLVAHIDHHTRRFRILGRLSFSSGTTPVAYQFKLHGRLDPST